MGEDPVILNLRVFFGCSPEAARKALAMIGYDAIRVDRERLVDLVSTMSDDHDDLVTENARLREVAEAARFVVRARHTAAMNTDAWIDQNLAPALESYDEG